MRLKYRQTRGRLAILAVIAMALVACGAGPGATQDPVEIPDITLKVGGVYTTSLADKFSGTDLTYSATPDKPSVATATYDKDKDILTVTAVGPGTATITVTATNPQGSAPQTFTVTVPPPEDDEPEPGAPTVITDAPASVDVDQGDTETVTLSRVFTGEDLEFNASSSDPAVATASEGRWNPHHHST